MITKDIAGKLPSTFGVYIFKHKDEVLYVGKSINIKARVISHLENAPLDRKENLIVSQSDSIEHIITESEFKALLLESSLIKKYHPKYNIIWKDNKSYLYIKITKSEFPKVLLSRSEFDGKSTYFGPFSSVKVATNLINDIRHIFPFCTQITINRNPCFYSKIGLCHPCPNSIAKIKDKIKYNAEKKEYRKNIQKIIKILDGKVKPFIKNYYKQLKNVVREERFEDAIKIRSKILRLERLMHYPLSKNDFNIHIIEEPREELMKLLKPYFPDLTSLDRIEGYDISNLGQSFQVASMVVATLGRIDKSQYRKFKINNTGTNNDFERLREVIGRRFKQKWPIPSLLVIDGGRPQVKIISKTIKELSLNIPIIGIAKNPDRLIINYKNLPTLKPSQHNKGFNLIRQIRDESHRFARKYHLFLRGKDFLI